MVKLTDQILYLFNSDCLIRALGVDGGGVTFAGSAMMWDETGQKIVLKLISADRCDATNPAQQKATWQIMVTAMSFVWGWVDSGGKGVSFKLDTTIPPVPLVGSANANSIWHSLTDHPFTRDAVRFQKQLMDRVQLPFDISEIDAATANDRVVAYHFMTRSRHWLSEYIYCRSHQNQLIVLILLMVNLGLRFMSDLFSLAQFIRMGTHFLRILLKISAYVRDHLDIEPGSPSEDDLAYAAELKDYLLSHYGEEGATRERQLDGETRRVQSQSKERRAKAIDDWCGVCNTAYDCKTGRVKHKCAGITCCPRGRPDTEEKLAKALPRGPLRAQPMSPAHAKWTKVGPVVDFMVWGFQYDFLPCIFELACGSLIFKDGEEAASADVDSEFHGTTQTWHKLAGSRQKRSKAFLRDSWNKISLVIWAVMLEPLRILTVWFLTPFSLLT